MVELAQKVKGCNYVNAELIQEAAEDYQTEFLDDADHSMSFIIPDGAKAPYSGEKAYFKDGENDRFLLSTMRCHEIEICGDEECCTENEYRLIRTACNNCLSSGKLGHGVNV